ncbi:hypothetical protein WDU94_005250 [Cyamophila willieti]
MRSYLIKLLLVALAPSYSYSQPYSQRFIVTPRHILGKGWDVQEDRIKGPDGFIWQKSPETPRPPLLSEELNQLAWCPTCFLTKTYGKPTGSYQEHSTVAPPIPADSTVPPKLKLGGFDIWDDRVAGNGWDIRKEFIKGPNGFSWKPNSKSPTPPFLPPPLNELVWCSSCFLRRAYGSPTWSYNPMRSSVPSIMRTPETPPVLHLRGFDIWKNRVLGNGWDIQENFIKGPGGFSWQKSKATPTPPSLPPPLNEIVWCPGCFLEKSYGTPVWSVDMSKFRREPTLVEPPNSNEPKNSNDFKNKQLFNVPVPPQQYLPFRWQQPYNPYMAPQPPFFIQGMSPLQYSAIPPFAMSQFPPQSMPISNPFIFQRPPYFMPFPPPNGIHSMIPNEPNPILERPSEEDEDLLPPEVLVPLPNEHKTLTPRPVLIPFPKYEQTTPSEEQTNPQKNEVKLPSEGQIKPQKTEDKPLTSPPSVDSPLMFEPVESEGDHYSPPNEEVKLPPKDRTQPSKNEGKPLTSAPSVDSPLMFEPVESEGDHYSPPNEEVKLPPKDRTQPPKNEDKPLTSPPSVDSPLMFEPVESEGDQYSPPNDGAKLTPKDRTQPPKNEDKPLTSPPSVASPLMFQPVESEQDQYSPPNDEVKLTPKDRTQPPKNEDKPLTSPPSVVSPLPFPPSNRILSMKPNEPNPIVELPSEQDKDLLPPEEFVPLPKDEPKPLTPHSALAPLAKYEQTTPSAERTHPQKNEVKLPSEGQIKPPKTEDRPRTSPPSVVSPLMFDPVGSEKSTNPKKNDQEVPTKELNSNKVPNTVSPDTTDNSPEVEEDSSIAQNIGGFNFLDPVINFVGSLFSSKPSDGPKPTPLDFQNSMRDPELAEENSLKNKEAPLKQAEKVDDKNAPVKKDLLPNNNGQPNENGSISGDQTVPMIQQHNNHRKEETGSDDQDKKQREGNAIISEDENKDDTQKPKNTELKEEKAADHEILSENKEPKEEKPETHDEEISKNKEQKPELQDESKKQTPVNNEEAPEDKESTKETPEKYDEQVPENKEQNPEVQDDEKDQGRHGIERPGVDFITNTGTIKHSNKRAFEIEGTKFNILDAPGKVVRAKEYTNGNNQPVREVYVNDHMVEKYVNKKKVPVQRGIKKGSKNNCDDIKGKFEDTIDFTKRFHRIYTDDINFLSEVSPNSVHLKTVNKQTGDLYEEKYTLGPDGKLILQKINGAVICGKL